MKTPLFVCSAQILTNFDTFDFTERNLHLHSHKIGTNNWVCNDGYLWDDTECRKMAVCSKNEYNVDDFTCKTLPENAHSTGYSWACNDDYFEDYKGHCLKIADACASNEVFDKAYKTCQKIPDHAEKFLDGLHWECKEGYPYNALKGECEREPIEIPGNLSFEIGGSFGFIANTELVKNPLFISGEIGVEWLFGESFFIGPAITLERTYINRYNDVQYFSYRINAAMILLFNGDNFTKWYLRPFVSANLDTDVKSGDDALVYRIPAAAYGLEFGFRLGNSHKDSNFDVDLYMGVSSSYVRDDFLESDDWTFYAGARLILF